MDGIASFLSYGQPMPLNQSIEELQHSLLCTTLELKSVQLAVEEEKRRNEENIKQLFQLLQIAFQERDEAKDHLQRLLNKITESGIYPVCYVPHSKPESSPLIPTKGNSSIAVVESDCLSETYNHHSYVSSSVDSLFDAVSPSPDLPNINIAEPKNIEVLQEPFIKEHSVSTPIGRFSDLGQVDPASAIIDRLAARKALPEKGKLLQTVVESGPLLQTLLLAGPLPQWRNPPPLQPVQIPPISITGSDPNQHVTRPPIASCHENAEVKTETCSTSFFNFSGADGSCMKKQLVSSSGTGNELSHNPSLNLNLKRRRVK